MSATAITIQPLTVNIGAELRGVDLHQPLSSDDVATVKQAVLDRFVVFFPDQGLDPAQQVAFARQLGGVTPYGSPFGPGLEADGYPEVAPQERSPDGAGVWHTDATFLQNPPGAAVFNAVDVPDTGGDTEYASTAVAYETLSRPIRELCDELVAVHDWSHLNQKLGEHPGHWNNQPLTRLDPVEHPVVRTHPATGRSSLYLSPNRNSHLPGLPAHASRHLLRLLYDHITRPEHTLRYHWRSGTVAIWDNRTVLHRAIYDLPPDASRIVHRVNLSGERPYGPATVSRAAAT